MTETNETRPAGTPDGFQNNKLASSTIADIEPDKLAPAQIAQLEQDAAWTEPKGPWRPSWDAPYSARVKAIRTLHAIAEAPAKAARAALVEAAGGPEGLPGETPLFGKPKMEILSAARSAAVLNAQIGSGLLSGYFRRGGRIVFTPRIGEAGYVMATDAEADNGPMQIHPATPESIQGHVQFAYECFKKVRDRKTGEVQQLPDGKDKTTDAVFPLEAAKLVVNNPIPHEIGGPRPLRGITHTPLVRKDGTILATPGYDKATGYLYAPDADLAVPEVSTDPTPAEVEAAVALLDTMVDGFVWRGKHDKANLYGLLLTPLLRLITPPPYKMFAVDAHQPGSGKTLLANTSRWIHGGVFRTEMPTEEPELNKLITSVLYTTTAPLVLVDNVTGSLKSSTLAGLLTSREYSDRILGRTENVSLDNDRAWVITGNNVAIGGDLGRRTITIAIDPGVPNPEARTGFAIADLEQWVEANRGRLLYALLTLVTAWTAAGQPLQSRDQSDGYTAWERAVGGILERAGVPGTFDHSESRNMRGDDEEKDWTEFLEAVRRTFGTRPFFMAELLGRIRQGTPTNPEADSDPFPTSTGNDLGPPDMPTAKLEEQARIGRLSSRSLGNYLSNRQRRWFGSLTVEPTGERDKVKGQAWRIRHKDEPR